MKFKYPLCSIALAVLNTALAPHLALAADASKDTPKETPKSARVEFNPAMLMGNTNSQDITNFGLGNPVVAGTYRYDLYINSEWRRRLDVKVMPEKDIFQAKVCINRDLLNMIPIDVQRLSESNAKLFQDIASGTKTERDTCTALPEFIDGSTVKILPGDLKLEITVPQIMLSKAAAGRVSKELWEDGVTAASLNYALQRYQSKNGDITTNGTFGSFDLGASLGAFRLRYNSTAFTRPDQSTQYAVGSSYVYTDIPSINGKLLLGSTSTSGQQFPNVKLKGLQLNSDDRMLPVSMRGYAPVIRGIAKTSGRVIVSQRGVVIYQMAVAPGPYEISDLVSGGYGGDLLVTLVEADGTQSSSTVSYSATPQLLRENAVSYQLSLGDYDEGDVQNKYSLFQGSFSYGIDSNMTVSSGAIFSKRYKSLGLGAAFGTPIGAVSIDLLNSFSEIVEGRPISGNSIRLGYATVIPVTQTNFAVATYQDSSENYLSLDRAMSQIAGNNTIGTGIGQREQLVVSLSQSYGEYGSLYGTASRTSFWFSDSIQSQFQLGWSKSFGRSNLSLNASRQIDAGQTSNRLSVSFVTQVGNVQNPLYMSSGAQRGDDGQTQGSIGLSGLLNEKRTARYSLSASGSTGGQASIAASTSLATAYGAADANLSSYADNRNLYLGFRGAVVAHAGGVTVSPSTGDTVTIVHAPGAAGAGIVGGNGARLDSSGYGVYPYGTPYSTNNIELDLAGFPLDIDMATSSRQVVPKSGAITLVEFASETAKYVVIKMEDVQGVNFPFGTDVFDENNTVVGHVGQGGKVQARLKDANTKLFMRSSKLPGNIYSIAFNISDERTSGLLVMNGTAILVDDPSKRMVEKQKMDRVIGRSLTSVIDTDARPLVKANTYPKEAAQLVANTYSPEKPSLDTRIASKAADGIEKQPQSWRRIVGTIRMPDGQAAPEGASLKPFGDANGNVTSIGRDGRFVIRLGDAASELMLEWGDKQFEKCKINVASDARSNTTFTCSGNSGSSIASVRRVNVTIDG